MKRLLLYLSLFNLVACSNRDRTVETTNPNPRKTICIDIQPFPDMSLDLIVKVNAELLKITPNVAINRTIALPASAYYSKRGRYRADSLIRFLKSKTPEGHITIGMTTKDISTTKGQKEDYGIMGLGYQPGKACVVSTFRLKKRNLTDQFVKLSLHELGHTAGLPHCPISTCFMRDAEGKNQFDKETGFCDRCKTYLTVKGWTLESPFDH